MLKWTIYLLSFLIRQYIRGKGYEKDWNNNTGSFSHPRLPPLSQITWRRESSSSCLSLGSCFEASLGAAHCNCSMDADCTNLQLSVLASTFPFVEYKIYFPSRTASHSAHTYFSPPHLFFSPLPSLSALKMLWWCCSLVLYLSRWEFNSSSIVNPYILLLMFLPSGAPYSSAKTTTS